MTVRLILHQRVIATVHGDVQSTNDRKPLLLESQGDGIVQSKDALLEPSAGGWAHLMISNSSGCSAMITEGTEEISVSDMSVIHKN